MKNIVKNIIITSLTLSLILPANMVFANSEIDDNNTSKLGNALEALQNTKMSSTKKAELATKIMNNSSTEEKEEYLDEVEDIVRDFLAEEVVFDSDSEQVYDLGSGLEFHFNATDKPITTNVINSSDDQNFSVNGYDPGPYQGRVKLYGDRLYNAYMKVVSTGVTIGTLQLANGYSVGDYGLKMRYARTTGTSGIYPFVTISSSSASITDALAEKVGYNMNAVGQYSWTLGIDKVGKSFTSSITSTIKLQSLDKVKKSAYVVQSYNFVE